MYHIPHNLLDTPLSLIILDGFNRLDGFGECDAEFLKSYFIRSSFG
jgi:hypothetical protein